MKKLILISALLLVVIGCEKKEPALVFAGSELDLKKFKALNSCGGCDLRGADLGGADFKDTNLNGANLKDANLESANLEGANLTKTQLENTKLDGAKFCKAQMPWGEVNDNC